MLAGYNLKAQQKWTLNQCISFAVQNNVNLKEYEIQEKLSSENLKQSKRNLLPGLSASANAGLSFGRSVDPITNDYVTTQFFNNNYNFASSIILFDGFRLQNQIKYEKFRKQQSEYNHLNAIDDLAFSVMTAFFDVIYYEGMLVIAREQVEASKLNLKTTEKQVEVGLKARSDLLEMRANLEFEELNQIQIENNIKTAVLQLKQHMNLISSEKLELVSVPESVFSMQNVNPQNLFDQFTKWSPHYQSFEASLKASEKNLSLNKSGLFPYISARGAINTAYSETNRRQGNEIVEFREQLKNNKNQYLGASMNIPVFSRWLNRSNVKRAKLQLEQAKTLLESERQRLFFEMTNNLNDLEALYKEFNQFEKQKEADTLAFRAAEKKFD